MEYGCIGEKLPHSFSKEIHEKIGGYDYKLVELPRDALDAFLKARDFKAINVTIPYKQAVIPYLSDMSDVAKKIGAVNTIVNRQGKLYGYNTDFYGLKNLLERETIDLKNKKVLILGSGGTSKTAFAVAGHLNAKEIYKVGRKKDVGVITYEEAAVCHGDAEFIINTTPVGMYPHIDEIPIDFDKYPSLRGVIDAVYNPLCTKFVQQARSKGIKAQGGLFMLVSQAVKAYEIFSQTQCSAGVSEKIYCDIFSSKQNIVLTGMPGSGKTTVGRALAKKLKREFIDTDDEIVKKAGMSIPDIFRKFSEDHFRALETEVIKEVSKRSGCVIATGGGAILKKENMDFLKMNGKIYFRDRPLQFLLPTSDRPLSSDREDLIKRYNERIELYISTADEIINTDNSISAAVNEIERRHFS